MDIIIWIILGGFAGWIASMIMKTDGSMGPLANIVVGILGAFIGGWVVNLFGTAPAAGQLNIPSLLTAILGAVILLAIIRYFTGRK